MKSILKSYSQQMQIFGRGKNLHFWEVCPMGLGSAEAFVVLH
jgi:hypothetical protein